MNVGDIDIRSPWNAKLIAMWCPSNCKPQDLFGEGLPKIANQ